MSRIIRLNGASLFEINGQTYTPALFRSFRPMPSTVSAFYRSGIRLYQVLVSGRNSTLNMPYSAYGGVWEGDDRYNFDPFDRQMAMFERFAPEAKLLVMIQLDTPLWYLENHHDIPDSYTKLGLALHYRDWVEAAKRYLSVMIAYTQEKYADRVFGYSCSAGCATEWFDNSFVACDHMKLAAFRQYMGDPNTVAPTAEDLKKGDSPLSLRQPGSLNDHWLRFSCECTGNLILEFAMHAQKIIHHQNLFGIFFGYMDCPNNYLQNLWAAIGYEKVWRSPDIDIFFSPAAYGECRQMEGVSSYQYLVDSLALHSKLYLHEIDHRTYLAGFPSEDGRVMESMCDAHETIQILRRELAATMYKDGALWWFDFLGGYYASPELEREITMEKRVMDEMYRHPHENVAEVAVFSDPYSMLLLREQENLSVQLVRYARNALNETGAPWNHYNLSDLDAVDLSRFKLVIFLNTFRMPDEFRVKIRSLPVQKVFLYAPGIAVLDELNQSGVEDLTEISLRQVDGTTQLHVETEDGSFGFDKPVSPIFAVDDASAEVLGTWRENGMCAIGRKGNSTLICAGNVPTTVFRRLMEDAGVHLYTRTGGTTYVDSRMICRQTMHEKESVITMKKECTAVDVFTGIQYQTKDKQIRIDTSDGQTRIMRILDDKDSIMNIENH